MCDFAEEAAAQSYIPEEFYRETADKDRQKADVIFCPNGNTIVFINKEQSPEHQKSWFKMFVDFLDTSGINILNSKFTMPDGTHAEIVKTSNGYSWRLF